MPRFSNSTLRRFRKANRLLQTGSLIMRSYSYCSTRGYFCVLSSESAHYKRCFRVNRQYELAPSDTKIERLYKKVRKLFDEVKETRIKAVCLTKQRRAIFKRFRALSDRED
jgi:hypothetical protein